MFAVTVPCSSMNLPFSRGLPTRHPEPRGCLTAVMPSSLPLRGSGLNPGSALAVHRLTGEPLDLEDDRVHDTRRAGWASRTVAPARLANSRGTPSPPAEGPPPPPPDPPPPDAPHHGEPASTAPEPHHAQTTKQPRTADTGHDQPARRKV